MVSVSYLLASYISRPAALLSPLTFSRFHAVSSYGCPLIVALTGSQGNVSILIA